MEGAINQKQGSYYHSQGAPMSDKQFDFGCSGEKGGGTFAPYLLAGEDPESFGETMTRQSAENGAVHGAGRLINEDGDEEYMEDEGVLSDDDRNKGLAKWDRSEDELLRHLVLEHGTKHWNLISQKLPGRTGKQCRLVRISCMSFFASEALG